MVTIISKIGGTAMGTAVAPTMQTYLWIGSKQKPSITGHLNP